MGCPGMFVPAPVCFSWPFISTFGCCSGRVVFCCPDPRSVGSCCWYWVSSILPVSRFFPFVTQWAVADPVSHHLVFMRSLPVPAPSRHGSWSRSRSRHPSPGRRSPSQAASSGRSRLAHSSSAHSGSICSLTELSRVSSYRSSSLRRSHDCLSSCLRARPSSRAPLASTLGTSRLLIPFINTHWTMFFPVCLIHSDPLTAGVLLVPHLVPPCTATPARLFLAVISRICSCSCSHHSLSSVVGSSRVGSGGASSARSHGSRSLSRASSRNGSCSPDGSHRRSPSHRADKIHQEEQPSLDFMNMVAHMWAVNDFLELHRKAIRSAGFAQVWITRIRRLCPISCLWGGTSTDILADIDNRISSSTTGMRSKKVSKLLPYPGVHSRLFYRFGGEEGVIFCSLNRHVTELAGML